MNYEKIYFDIINRGKGRVKEIGLERHHIIPASCGGSNNPENLVFLTLREHFICHLLLIKIYRNNPFHKRKMIYAAWWMAKTKNQEGRCRVTSRTYEKLRREFIENSPSRLESTKRKVKENRENGLYKYDYEKVSATLKNTLSNMPKEQLQERMKNSALNCDQEKRALAIRKGKGSQMELTKPNGEKILFWTYDDIQSLTGFNYDQIKYRIRKHNGLFPDGTTVKYTIRYTANDKNIRRNRDISS